MVSFVIISEVHDSTNSTLLDALQWSAGTNFGIATITTWMNFYAYDKLEQQLYSLLTNIMEQQLNTLPAAESSEAASLWFNLPGVPIVSKQTTVKDKWIEY